MNMECSGWEKKSKECIVPDSIKFLQQTFLMLVDRGEEKRLEKLAWLRNTSKQCLARDVSLSIKCLLLGICMHSCVHRAHSPFFIVLFFRWSGSFSCCRWHTTISEHFLYHLLLSSKQVAQLARKAIFVTWLWYDVLSFPSLPCQIWLTLSTWGTECVFLFSSVLFCFGDVWRRSKMKWKCKPR